MEFTYSDGRPTSTGLTLLKSLTAAGRYPEEIALQTGMPLFRVREGLRQLVNAGLAIEIAGKYTPSSKGLGYILRP